MSRELERDILQGGISPYFSLWLSLSNLILTNRFDRAIDSGLGVNSSKTELVLFTTKFNVNQYYHNNIIIRIWNKEIQILIEKPSKRFGLPQIASSVHAA